MDPLTFAVLLFGTAATGIISYGINRYREGEQLELADKNLALNENVSNQNFELSKEQFEYQKELNQIVMGREDNAIQRAVADAKAAGLSPLAVTGGSSATPLTSANAPQRDISGINQAVSNTISAYNDIYNRKLNRQQFALQSAVQSSQAYTQLMESKLNRKYLGLQIDYLDEKMKWEKIHGFRDLDWKSELLNLLEGIGSKMNNSSVIPDIGNIVSASMNNVPNSTPTFRTVKDLFNPKPENNNNWSPLIADSDINKIEKAQKARVDKAFITIGISKDFSSSARTIWDYTNASKYYKDYEEFVSVIGSKRASERKSYLEKMGIEYTPRKRLKLGQ